ncbi:hypothetical protein AB0H34_39210 [Saccharopolyspora shandongensis]|uniref:hypothetical protein n=1 Tax=Saccharopolyspora shandongensis TaxID=418495 RepID=UPI0033DC38B2
MRITQGNIRENRVVEFEEGRRIAWLPSEPVGFQNSATGAGAASCRRFVLVDQASQEWSAPDPFMAGAVNGMVDPWRAELVASLRSPTVETAADFQREKHIDPLEGECTVHVEEVHGQHGRGLCA